jgi:dTDP-4-dehydrorhamnose reductase
MFLITGANGQLGLSLKKLLKADQAYFCSHQDLDITNAIEPKKFAKVSAIINCAAYTNVEKAEDELELAFKINGKALKHLTDLSNNLKIPLIHISTDYVFDGTKNSPYLTSDKTNPLSAYGKSKLLGEEIFIKEAKCGLLIRTSWVYSEFGNNFVKTMLRLGKERAELSVVNDQWGSPTYATDLALTILQILNNEIRGVEIEHFSNSGAITWFDFAQAIMQEANLSCQIRSISSEEYKSKVKRPSYAVLDKKSIEEKYQIKLKDWKESLKTCLKNIG